MNEYWARTLHDRLSRRKALARSLSFGSAAALLLACGGKEDTGPIDTSGLLTKPVDTTRQAVRGGTMVLSVTTEPPHFNPLLNSVGAGQVSYHAYPHIFNYKVGTVDDPPDGSVEGDVVSAWETSPDRLKVTMKLRPNVKLDPRAPTTGRNLSVDDIRWSMDHWRAIGPSAKDMWNDQNPDAPVKGISFPDTGTIVLDLAFPYPAIFRMLGFLNWFYVLPKEAEGGFNVRSDTRGSGPWMLTNNEPSVRYRFQRNPNWWKGPDVPYLDGIDYQIIPTAVTALAQFEAGQLWNQTPTNDNVVRLKRDHPELQMQAISPLTGQLSMQIIALSKLPNDPINRDVRIRHAISMLMDRDGFIEAFNNVKQLQAQGVPVETGWHTHVPASWPNQWLDPKTNKLGEASKYFQFNADEAAKLLRAAGAFGQETNYTSDTRGTTATRLQVFTSMLQDGGHFKLKVDLRDYNGDYLPNYVFNQGKFPGISQEHTNGAWPDLDFPLFVLYHPNGRNAMVTEPLPKIQEIMVKHRQEPDEKKRIELAHEWQKEMALQMPTVPHPGAATTFTLSWPWLKNYGYFQQLSAYNGNQELVPRYWYDKSQDKRA